MLASETCIGYPYGFICEDARVDCGEDALIGW